MRQLLALMVAATLAACGGGSATPIATPSDLPTGLPTAPSEAPSDLPLPVIDWADLEPVDLGDGWIVRDCDGDAPLLCFDRNGEFVGLIELNTFPVPAELAGVGSEDELVAAMRTWATDNLDGVVADRSEGCGADYEVEVEAPVEQTVAGNNGVRYGFRGIEGGAMTEYVISYATVADDQLWIVVADGAADGGCMGSDELDLFDPAVLETLVPLLDRVVAGMVLPDAPVS
jgi:hypothetical protein